MAGRPSPAHVWRREWIKAEPGVTAYPTQVATPSPLVGAVASGTALPVAGQEPESILPLVWGRLFMVINPLKAVATLYLYDSSATLWRQLFTIPWGSPTVHVPAPTVVAYNSSGAPLGRKPHMEAGSFVGVGGPVTVTLTGDSVFTTSDNPGPASYVVFTYDWTTGTYFGNTTQNTTSILFGGTTLGDVYYWMAFGT